MKSNSGSKNIKKTALRILWRILLIIVLLPVLISLIFQIPAIQTYTAQVVSSQISKSIEQEIRIDGVKIGIFSGVNIYGLKVYDHHDSIMLGVGSLSAKPIFSNFSFSNIRFSKIIIDSAEFRMGSYKGENKDNLSQMIANFRSDSSEKGSSTFKMKSKVIKLSNSRLNIFNENRSYDGSERMMDYANLLFTDINTTINSFILNGDSLNFEVSELKTKENCGLDIKKMSTDFTLSSKCLIAENAIVDVNESTLDLDFRMDYGSYAALSSYIDSVTMTGTLRPTSVNMADIGHFADILFKMPNMIGITGNIKGKVTDLSCNNIRVKYGSDTRVSGDIRFVGLPDFFSSHITGNKLSITSNPNDISTFYLPIESKHLDITSLLPADETISVTGNFDGYYTDFTSDMDINLNEGKVITQLQFQNKEKLNIVTTLESDSLKIAKLLGLEDILGITSFNIQSTIAGSNLEDLDYTLKSKFTHTDLFGYNYKRIKLTGSYINDSINANLVVGDKNLMLNSLLRSKMGSDASFLLDADIVKANLKKILPQYDIPMGIASDLHANIAGSDIKTANADILLKNSKLTFVDSEYLIDSIHLIKTTNKGLTKMNLKSDITDIDASGYFNLETVSTSILKLINGYYNYFIINEEDEVNDSTLNINVSFNDPRIISKELISGIRLSKNTKLNSSFDFKQRDLQLNLSSPRLSYNDIRADSINLSIDTSKDSLIAEFAIRNFILKDSTYNDTVVLGVDNFSVSTNIHQDSLVFGMSWDNRNAHNKNQGDLSGYVSTSDDTTNFSIGDANIYINHNKWVIDPDNLVSTYNGQTYFKNIVIKAAESIFKLNGTLPKEDSDSLVADFYQWDLSNFDLLTKPNGFYLDGLTNGQLKLNLIHDNPTLISNINISRFGLNGTLLGNAEIMNRWDNNEESIFMKASIVKTDSSVNDAVFNANGYYYPFRDGNNIDLNISFNKFKLVAVEPFLSTFVNELEGYTDGQLKLSGSYSEPVITGKANMQDAGMRVVYLNTKYSFSNSIDFVKNGIKFDNLVIYDTLGNRANIDGELTHNYFNNPYFNIKVTTDGLLFFNTKESMNSLYYGTAIASGNLDVEGSPNDIDLTINASTKRGTNVTLPLDYSVEISDKDYIVFIQADTLKIKKADLIDEIPSEQKKLNYNIGINMNVTPVAQVKINLPDDMGNITASGNSNLALDVNSDGDFNLVGDYIVQQGSFLFRIGNLVSKRFELVNGGRISWSGNPYGANVNIKGLYKVKTSLSSLGITIDSTASYKNRVTVECYVILTNELLNPNIRFSIKFPDLDPDYQRAVFSELDTTNTAMMNQQMISLLVLGTFSFNNASNVSLQSSYYNVIANQLSSLLSQISKNVDVGFNYKPGDQISSEEFEVALSTQLFDNRLTIDGNFGMTYDRSEQSASNIVGDVDIGYKLTEDGRWVLKVFNHSNVNSWYNYSGYDQTSPYTQGVGIAFRKDFNNIKGLFERRNKSRKDKKNAKELNNSATKEEGAEEEPEDQ